MTAKVFPCSDSSSGGKTEGIPVTGKWTDDRTPTFSPTTDESDDVPSQSPPLQGNRARSFRWLRPPVPNRPPFCYLLSTSKCRSFWLSSVPYRHRRKPAPKRYEVSRKSIGGHKSQNFLIRPGSGLSRSKLAKNGQKNVGLLGKYRQNGFRAFLVFRTGSGGSQFRNVRT